MDKRIFFALALPMFLICILPPNLLVHQARASGAGRTTLADAINGCNLSPNSGFYADDPFWSFYGGLSFARSSLSGYDNYIQQYASAENWLMVLRIKRLAEEDGYDSPVIDNATQQALSSMQMLENLPVTETWGGGTWFADYDRYIINAYRYAQQNGQTTRWNQTAAYQELLSTYDAIGKTVYGYNPITMTGYLNDFVKYYDTLAQTLDCFVKLGGNDAGIWTAMNTPGNPNNCWTGTMYGYTPSNLEYECEFGFFALIMGNYYVASGRTIPYFNRVYEDLYSKALVNGWNSSAWGSPGVIQHATGNPELRMPNTLGAILALQAFCGTSSWESSFVNLLAGSTAWQGLMSSYLYSSGQFLQGQGATPDAFATAMGMKTLFLYGIIPNTGSLAIPLNDEAYEGASGDLPSSLFSFDYANKRIRIAVTPGVLEFQYGTGIVSYVFPSAGVYELQFDNSWNTITNSSLIEPLPSLFQYLPQVQSSPVAKFNSSPSSPVAGEPVTLDASSSLPGLNGTNTMSIVLYSWDFGDGNTSAGQIVTHKFSEPGNYTVSLNVTDSEGLWNVMAQQIQVAASLPLFASIGPSSTGIPVGQSIVFASNVSGGVMPYSYQWYLNGDPVSAATNFTWIFSPTLAGSYTVYVAVTDSATTPASAQSNNANVTVAEHVYITSDGSVVPSSAPISSPDNVTYTFTGDVSYPTYLGIVVERSNIVIDGDGYAMQGNNISSGAGLSLTGISNVTIENMNIEGFEYGIWLNYSSSNIIFGNNITNNGDGIVLSSSSSNVIYHCNFTDNGQQVFSLSSMNAWDNGYPSGGNYWSDYVGVDLCSGPQQNEPGSDGIGDAPYVIDANNTDNYPLMNPYSSNSLCVVIAPASSTLVTSQTLLFTSTISGGILPYNYQWYLNGSAVQGATSSSWIFRPTSSCTVYLNVTDSVGAIAISNTATVAVNIFGINFLEGPYCTQFGTEYWIVIFPEEYATHLVSNY